MHRPKTNSILGDPNKTWAEWLIPKPFDLVTSILYLCALSLFLYRTFPVAVFDPVQIAQAVAAVIAIFGLLLIDRIEYQIFREAVPPRPAVLLLGVRIVLIEVFARIDDFNFSPFLYLLVPFYASIYFGIRIGYWMAVSVWAFYVGKLFWYRPDWYLNTTAFRDFLIFSLGLTFAMTMANVMSKEKAIRARAEHLLAELEESNSQLRAYAEQVEELATIKERNRLARDIHDSLGHYLTVINVQLAKALTVRREKPEEAERAVSDAKQMAGEALRDVRSSVRALRAGPDEEPFVLAQALEALVAHTRNGLLKLDLRIHGDEEGFSRQTLISVYRAAQEGLTNVQKHAKAGSVTLTLEYGADDVRLSLVDDGLGFTPSDTARSSPEQDGGFGLQGIRERLELVGGLLRIESRSGSGTSLLVVVPRDGAPNLQATVGTTNGSLHER